jgi:hypothetical protein
MPTTQATGGTFWSWPVTHLSSAVVSSPLALVISDPATPGAALACGDLPVSQALLLTPLPNARPATAKLDPAPDWEQRIPGGKVSGTVKVWPTPGGDYLLSIDSASTDSDVIFRPAIPLWHVATGTCRQWQRGGTLTDVKVLARVNYPIETPGRQSFSLILPANWSGEPLVLIPFVQGGGPMVACAQIPRPKP